ncbi:gliding motility-associated C-terminal domain-containing protein [Flavobacterium akiainvivens]|nr:gliding motility-associated C-terminal domain-containing protein [Flavobacterium akiainvivens]
MLLLSCFCIAQKEANNWFFGNHAGIKFNDNGSVSILSGSQMTTNEGCSTISDPDGNLLFYTDGRTVWDHNHIVMPNANYTAGTGLMGDPSSTLSGIIVPKKGDPNIYYVFTVDEPHHQNADAYPNQYTGDYFEPNGTQFQPAADDGFNNGLNYSVVDLSVAGTNGSSGDVTTSNVHLLTYDPNNIDEAKYKCSEKITAVKNHNGTGYWVLAHFTDKFYAFFIDNNGVNSTPVVTALTPLVPVSGYRRNAIGCFKVSPDGNYLAIAHQQLGTVTGGNDSNGCVYLYDFDNQTGIVSNPQLIVNNVNPYGVEFSPQSKKLYVSVEGSVLQYDLESSNIPGSSVTVAFRSGTSMQLGPNGKIYKTVNGSALLDVINDPDELGTNCNYAMNGVALENGTYGVFGLPPFITSLFSAAIKFEYTCLGDTTEFELDVNNSFDAVSWNFGDGSAPSTDTAPQHTFATAGTYNVIATITREGETSDVSREVIIHETPNISATPTITECDPDNDGIATFKLSDNNASILGSLNASQFTVKYFLSQADAVANTVTPLNATSYNNTANPQAIWVRVQNNSNNQCYAIGSFQIMVSNTPALGENTLELCDDDTDGNDANGQATFNLSTLTTQWVQSTGFTTTYYASETDAEVPQNPLPQNFNNTTPNSQVIYGRIVNDTYPDCFAILPVTLTVNPLPDNVQDAVLIQCDTGFAPDGLTPFNLTEANNQYTNGNANLSVAYYIDDTAAQAETGAISGAFTNTVNPQIISARVTNSVTGCYRILPLELHVTANVFDAVEIERCDDDGTEDGLALFDLTLPGFETPGTTVVYYPDLQSALMEQNAITTPEAYTNEVATQQSVFARIEENNACMAIREVILHVRPLPDIEVQDTARVCLNTLDFIQLDSGVSANAQNYAYLWSTGETTRTIRVNQPGVYTVTVTDITHATLCSKVRTITVTPSNIAHIDDVVVVDLTENNTVTVYASPSGGVDTSYLYSLDRPNGPWQESPYFENVEPGIHTLYVYDVNGCGIVNEQVSVLAIPKFFTPNGDGINDYWHITGINGRDFNNSKIFIFDRYGKLLSDVKATGPGWDGRYNGHDMPSTDYWFLLNLEDGRTIRGHFSMVR